jgi:hypothetical protein
MHGCVGSLTDLPPYYVVVKRVIIREDYHFLLFGFHLFLYLPFVRVPSVIVPNFKVSRDRLLLNYSRDWLFNFGRLRLIFGLDYLLYRGALLLNRTGTCFVTVLNGV